MDSDAPLIRPVNFWLPNLHVMGDIETQPVWDNGECFQVIRRVIKRILPFIQYMNVKYMEEKNIHYFRENILYPNIDCSFFISADWLTGFTFPTGSLLYKQAVSRGIPVQRIDHTRYVDHFGSATWNGNRNPHDFYVKYRHMFKNQEPFRK